jgi:hypothetical protein
VLADVARGLATAIADVRGRDGVHPGVAATALVAMLERFGYFWLVRGGQFDEDAVLDTVTTLLDGAIFTQRRARARGG